jgi:hypothetical protein
MPLIAVFVVVFCVSSLAHSHRHASTGVHGVSKRARDCNSRATGLTIIRNFNNTINDAEWPPGRSFGPPPHDLYGGGDLVTIFNVAADYWEQVFPNVYPPWTLQVDYGWASGGNLLSLYGQERVVTQGGSKLLVFSR